LDFNFCALEIRPRKLVKSLTICFLYIISTCTYRFAYSELSFICYSCNLTWVQTNRSTYRILCNFLQCDLLL